MIVSFYLNWFSIDYIDVLGCLLSHPQFKCMPRNKCDNFHSFCSKLDRNNTFSVKYTVLGIKMF